MALSPYAEARGLFLQIRRDPTTRARAQKGPRQTNPHARGAYKKSGELPTALSLCAEARGSSCDLAETKMGSTNEPSVRTKRICEGRLKKTGDPRPSSCSRRRLGGSSYTQKPRQKHDKGHRARYGLGVRRLGLQEVSTAAPGQQSQGRLRGEPTNGPGLNKQSFGGVLSRVRDRQESIRMGSHRREAPSHRGPANGLGTH